MRLRYIEVLFVFCFCEAFKTSAPGEGDDSANESSSGIISKPRRTLTYTYFFDRNPTLEETIHEQEDDLLSKFEANLLQDAPSVTPTFNNNNKLKADTESKKHHHKHLKRRKGKSHLKDLVTHDPNEGCQPPSKAEGLRLLEATSQKFTRASIIEALNTIQAISKMENVNALLNSESNSEQIDQEELLESLLIALARRSRSGSSSGSRSGSRSKGKGKSSKKRKRSGSKGKGKHKSRSGQKSSKSRSRKRRKSSKSRSSSSDSDSRSAASKDLEDSTDVEPVQDIENVFSDEFIDFLNDYYSTGTIESDSENVVETGSADSVDVVDDPLQDFIDRYYKVQESNNNGSIGEDDVLGDYYRDPDSSLQSPTPTPRAPASGEGIYNDDDIFSPKFPKNPSDGKPSSPSKTEQKSKSEDGKRSSVKSPPKSKKQKEGDKEEKRVAPSQSLAKESTVKSPIPSKSKKQKETKNDKKDVEANGSMPSPPIKQGAKKVDKESDGDTNIDIFNDDNLQVAPKNDSPSSSRKVKSPSSSSSTKKAKKQKMSKKRARHRRYIR